jgi:hypothetical protein
MNLARVYSPEETISKPSVECGGLPPLYAVPACRDVLQN